MSRQPDRRNRMPSSDDGADYIVVAGPGTSVTIPGVIVSEIVSALTALSSVRRIEVDLGTHPSMGLHRARSLTAAHDAGCGVDSPQHRVSRSAKARKRAFRQGIGSNSKLAVAYAWPGIDNGWIVEFLRAAKAIGVPTVVLCESLPETRQTRAISLVSMIRNADRVIVGDSGEANLLVAAFGPYGPVVQHHRSLSMMGRRIRRSPKQLTAFLPSESGETLTALVSAFDAISDMRIKDYNLHVIMRYGGSGMERIVANSYHARHVRLIGDNLSGGDVRQLCDVSSAFIVADPDLDSRAFSTAVNCGIVTVVLAKSKVPVVGRGYVGGLIADVRRPASIHVAMAHAIRLDELSFPSPESWDELVKYVIGLPGLSNSHDKQSAQDTAGSRSIRSVELDKVLEAAAETEKIP